MVGQILFLMIKRESREVQEAAMKNIADSQVLQEQLKEIH
jgi:hypothetical protein